MKYREFICAICGDIGIDRGNKQNKKYCSQRCNQKSNYLRKKSKLKTVSVCRYNEGVSCDSLKCAGCGWNPDVEKMRKEALA